MDLTIIAARVLLVVGTSCAALIPAHLGSSDDYLALRSQPVLLPAFTEPASTPDAPESVALGQRSWLRFDEGPVVPVPFNARFSRAEELPLPPVRVRIASQSIDAPIVPVGLTDAGEMEAPPGYDQVGWYRYGARPGEAGRAVLAGHLDSRNGPAVFFKLGALQPGDTIEVQFADGVEMRVFAVRQITQYPIDGAPLADIFGPLDHPELVLITCAGQFRGPDAGYSDRVIVYADARDG